MRPPISYVHGNLVLGSRLDDAWAAFSVPTGSYEWTTIAAKRARLSAFAAALRTLGADVQLLRVAEQCDLERYTHECERESCSEHDDLTRAYAGEQASRLLERGPWRPRLFLCVSLREPKRDVASYLSHLAEQHPRTWWSSLRDALAPREPRLLKLSELERLQALAERAHAIVRETLGGRPARTVELQWLVRRVFCRGLGEPLVDGLHEPRALTFERAGDAVIAPLEGDVLRWSDCQMSVRGRSLRIVSELGVSWQAQLALGALPESVTFPGPRCELMFAPPESLDFPIDLCLAARYLPNELALRIARRRIQDADQIARAEDDGEQGTSDLGHRRVQQARELLAYLQSSSRPPLLRSSLTVAVAALDERQLDARVQACQRAYGEIHLHRPVANQLGMFVAHLPGQRTRVAGYEDTLTIEQVAAMVPSGAHRVGSTRGFHLGSSISGSRQPVRFNLREGSDRDRNTAILSVGALGSGKTTLAQKLQYEAFLQGARIIDCDPKGDHGFHLLEQVAPHSETIAIRPDPALRGMLDPLRIAPEHLRHEAAVSFLCELLPGRAAPSWETVLAQAVETVSRRATQPTCGEVLRALREGHAAAPEVAEALEVHSRTGLTQLGFAMAGEQAFGSVGERQVTYIPIRDLPGPDPSTARSDYTRAERVGVQIVRLIAMFATHLVAREPERLKLFCFDEGWRLLGDPVGRSLLASLQRMGRSELAVALISTQLLSDALLGQRESFENLLGATFVFGLRSESEAARALELLGLDSQEPNDRERLIAMDAGRCLLRDHAGRIEAIQVELLDRTLRRMLG